MNSIRDMLSWVTLTVLTLLFTAYSISQDNGLKLRQIMEIVKNQAALNPYKEEILSGIQPDGKCGLGLSFEIWRRWDAFTPGEKQKLRALLAPADFQKSRVIGHFEVFYDTTGPNEPQLLDGSGFPIPNTAEPYIDSVGKYFNVAWAYEVDSLGYLSPPLETGASYYRIYVEELGSLLYGDTQFIEAIPGSSPVRYTTRIRVDNNYRDFYSEGISGLKVTSAHEFHHAIQIGRYGFWPYDKYFYEITSTWMEDVVHPEVNDYYQYLKTRTSISQPLGQFATPDVAFNNGGGLLPYSRAIWGKFIEKRFTRDVMRQTWDNMQRDASLPSIDQALVTWGSSLRQALLEWAVWNYHTGSRSDTLNYYTDGNDYPLISMRPAVAYWQTPRSFTDSIQALSSVYRPVCILKSPDDICSLSPQMVVIVSNLKADPPPGVDRLGFLYEINSQGGAGFKSLANGIFIRLDTGDPENWISQENVPTIVSEVVVYPNPFNPQGHKPLNFRLPPTQQPLATLYFFNSAMERILSKDFPVSPGEPIVQWDGHDGNGEIVASGVYFYVVKVDDKQYTGKFAVIKE